MRQPRSAPVDEPLQAPSTAPDHRVVFSTDVAALAGSVGRFLLPALTGGGVALLVAASAHRRPFLQAIAEAGVDVDAASRTGRLVVLDAEATLDRLLVGDEVDLDAFADVIGRRVADASGSVGPVRVYGEMVGLLWEQGRVGTLMALEECWNALGAALPFGLLCGYPAPLLGDADAADAVAAICGHHTEVLSSGGVVSNQRPGHRTARWQLPAALTSGALVRAHVRDLLRAWDLGNLLDEAELLVTELVNNAVLHAGSALTVSVSHRDVLRVEVSDAGRGALQRVDSHLDDTSGRGLMLVDAMSSAWGSETRGGGKTVWFELATA